MRIQFQIIALSVFAISLSCSSCYEESGIACDADPKDSILALQNYMKYKADSTTKADSIAEAIARSQDTVTNVTRPLLTQ